MTYLIFTDEQTLLDVQDFSEGQKSEYIRNNPSHTVVKATDSDLNDSTLLFDQIWPDE